MRGTAPPPEQGSGLAIRVLTAEDLGCLKALVHACPEAPPWPAPAWEHLVETEEGLRRRMSLIACAGDRAVLGMLAATLLGNFTELELLLVRPAARRRGVGTALLGEWLRMARDMGAETAHLEVRAANMEARRLYAAHGFLEQGRRPGYYRDPPDAAVLMEACWLSTVQVEQGGDHG